MGNLSDLVVLIRGAGELASGVVRGLLRDGTEVYQGMKAGDIDPRGRKENCYSSSDKARAVGGGVLEAIMYHCNR